MTLDDNSTGDEDAGADSGGEDPLNDEVAGEESDERGEAVGDVMREIAA